MIDPDREMNVTMMNVRYLLIPFLLCGSFAVAADDAFSPEQLEFFEREVRPILVERCYECHGPEEQEASLRLDSRAYALKGGDTGPAFVPHKPEESELVNAISYDPDGYQMPPEGKLPAKEIAILTKWVKLGAPWPGGDGDPAEIAETEFDLDERAKHWSFLPLETIEVPKVNGNDWGQNAIDAFVQSKLIAVKLSPAKPADRRTLIRRAYLDVIGLPPSPEQVQAFVDDKKEGAFDRVIEELLASPHYGERWGRHWLDLVRYAESRGHEFDNNVANPWPYRDYIIRALNADVPYDQIVLEHVAGDLLPQQDANFPYQQRLNPETGGDESILGTGFWFFGEWVHSPVDIRKEEADRFDNMIDVYSKTFLGLTVACARCHDHKFDPIRANDFYAIQGCLQSTSYRQVRYESRVKNLAIEKALQELRKSHSEKIIKTYSDTSVLVMRDLERYLIAAQTAGNRTADEIVQQEPFQGLSAKVLGNWVSYLAKAKEESSALFHAFAQRGAEQEGNAEQKELVSSATLAKFEALPRLIEAAKAMPDVEHRFEVKDLLSDSVGFQRSGDAMILTPSEDKNTSVAHVSDPQSIEWDATWDRLRRAPGTQIEPGKTGKWKREFHVRTPGFEIQSGKVWSLVRGGVNTYIAVDSHITIAGPLHGAIAQGHKANPDWHWVLHNVRAYQGHRAHLELVPIEKTDFAVAMVVQSEQRPPVPKFVSEPAVTTFGELAEAIAKRFHHADQNSVAFRFMVEHPQLFGLDSEPAIGMIASVATPVIAQQEKLLAEVQTVSHLAQAMMEGTGEDEYIFIRGQWQKKGEPAPRQFLEVFRRNAEGEPSEQVSLVRETFDAEANTGSGRLQLAMQMVDPDITPIVPRVITNRIWQHYFGRGICPTPNDFGHLGEEPSHPELLDWLANELVNNGWSMKHIHRLILKSSTYQQASHSTLDANTIATVDPENVLLHRMNIKRLEGEAIRDMVLTISGRLDRTMFGPSVPVYLTSFMEGRGRPGKSGPIDGNGRRSLYVSIRRNFLDPFFQAFDFPTPHSSIGRRNVSNVPAQALAMLNNPLIVQQSEVWAKRMLKETPNQSVSDRVDWLFASAFSRSATEEERADASAFLKVSMEELSATSDDPRVWSDYCHVLMNLKEFIFVR